MGLERVSASATLRSCRLSAPGERFATAPSVGPLRRWRLVLAPSVSHRFSALSGGEPEHGGAPTIRLVSASFWAAVAAIAAAAAAAASWGTVWQGRRERLAAQTPDLHIHTMFRTADRVIRVMLVNNGGLARNVAFHIWEGSGVVSGIPGPTATFLPGESRCMTPT